MTEDAAKRWAQWLLDQDYPWIIEAGSLIGEIRLDQVNLERQTGQSSDRD
jgi:hypothetical protein